MKINIIRGQNQIGGSIIEIATNTTKIILDVGINLGENKAHPYVPSVPGLFADNGVTSRPFTSKTVALDNFSYSPSYDAVFVSHYHSDHIGLLRYVLQGIPIYMGETAFKIVQTVSTFKDKELGFSVNNYLENLAPISIGDITVTPISCDHSAYGAFMFLIQASENTKGCSQSKSVLYTADYRSTGRKDFQKLLDSLPKVDVLITEGTTLSRGEDFHEPSEQELEDFAVELLSPRSGPAFMYLSAQNVDRITTAYCIAKRTNRRFIMDSLSSEVVKAAGLDFEDTVIVPSFEKGFGDFAKSDDSGAGPFASPDFLLCVTPQSFPNIMKLNRHLSFADSTLFFARRELYMLKPVNAALLAMLKTKGVLVSLLHTSGHADGTAIQRLIQTVNPSIIIPVHTEKAAWFSRFEDTCKIVYDCKDFVV